MSLGVTIDIFVQASKSSPLESRPTTIFTNENDELITLRYGFVALQKINVADHSRANHPNWSVLYTTIIFSARELKKTPPAYLQQRGQPGDGDGGGGGQRRDNYGEQRRNDDRHPRQVNQGDESRGRGGQRRESYGEQRRNENRHPQQVVQGDERGRNWGQNDDETREEEESAAGGQPLVPPPSLPHAPCQEGTVAQEDSCVFSGLSSSSAYDNITRNITRETEMYTQDESAEERPIVVEVQEQRETSSACADNLLPQSEFFERSLSNLNLPHFCSCLYRST